MKALIIEDEPMAAKRLEKMLLDITRDAEILEVLESIEESIEWLAQNNADLIFMDIHLADGSSFEIFDHLEITSPIIFITAYDEYAIQAFKVNAIDYLLKPIKKAELAEAIKKWEARTRKSTPNYGALSGELGTEKYRQRLLIRYGQHIRVVNLDEASYFFTEDKITFLVLATGKKYPVDFSLEKLEAMIDPAKFYRINRQYIISMNAIEDMYAYSKSRVKLSLSPPAKKETIVSTERSGRFKKWLTGDNL